MCVYSAKKRAAIATKDLPLPPARETRQDKEKADKKREAGRLAVQRHRANQHPDKKTCVREQRKKYCYRKNAERKELLRARREKSVQVEQTFRDNGCPYPTKDSYLRAVRRVKEKFRAKGVQLAHLLKGVIKTTDRQTQQHLKQLLVHCTTPHKHTSASSSPSKTLRAHIMSITKKRDKDALKHKRNLAQAFCTTPDSQRTGLSNQYLKQAARNMVLYLASGSKQKKAVGDYLDSRAAVIPCKSLKSKKQLLKPVSQLYKEYRSKNTASAVSFRSFHRLKLKHVQLVKKLKFRQCLSKICQNPKAKVMRLNFCLENKCERVKVLLDESVCAHEGEFPELFCFDRECPHCGVERVRVRLESELRGRMDKQIKWPEWELVKVGKSTRMEKVDRSGSVLECVTELLKELGPLYRHIPHTQF